MEVEGAVRVKRGESDGRRALSAAIEVARASRADDSAAASALRSETARRAGGDGVSFSNPPGEEALDGPPSGDGTRGDREGVDCMAEEVGLGGLGDER